MSEPTTTNETPACECSIAGWCARHNLNKTKSFHRLCQTRYEYRAMWDKGIGPGHPIERLKKVSISSVYENYGTPQTDEPCRHRGTTPREGHCNLCGGMKGQPFQIFSCDVHGDCSLRKRHSKVYSCLGCPDWTAVE